MCSGADLVMGGARKRTYELEGTIREVMENRNCIIHIKVFRKEVLTIHIILRTKMTSHKLFITGTSCEQTIMIFVLISSGGT